MMRAVGPVAEDTLRSALTPILSFACPTLFCIALLASRVDHVGANQAALSILLAAIGLTGLALRWRRHPPQHAHRAAALSIAIIQLALVGTLLAVPDPGLATLQVLMAVGIAFFLIDLRWMLSVQIFGIVCWFAATGLSETTPQWQIARIATLAGYGAACAFYLGRVNSMNRIRQLAHESQGLDEEARKSARALQASEAQLRNAQRIARVGSYEWDLEANQLHWSDEQYRIFGWDSGEGPIDCALLLERVHPDDRDSLIRNVADSIRDGTPVEIEFRVTCAHENERVVFWKGETYRNESGKPIRHAGTSLDITDRYRVEEALRESESRLLAILTAMDAERAVVVTRDGIVRSILGEAPTGIGRYGVVSDEVEGRAIHEFVPGEAGDRVLEAVEGVYATGGRAEVDATVEFPGGVFHFDVSLRALRSRSGDIESVLAIVRDMTQQKADAMALRQAQKLESLGLLAGGVAHDFNNLLVGVQSNAEIALHKIDALSPVRLELEDIVRASMCAAELTHELLAFVGTAKREAESVDLAALVEESVQLVRPGLAEGVTIDVDRKPEPAAVYADATQIRRVITNFITNAADAIGVGGGRVQVRTELVQMDRQALEHCTIQGTPEPGEYCRVEVSDSGAGMDRQTLDKIFDPFFTTKVQGRGLGLASTVGIVRAHGGAIHVESEPGRGSTFTVWLPRTALPLAKPRQSEPSTQGGSGTILVVDDESFVRSAIRRILESSGYRMLEASSGPGAVEILERESNVELALVDLTMPEMDGVRTFEALRALALDLPVLFMSGHSQEDLGQRVAGMERTSHITKPFSMGALIRAIAVLLTEHRAGGKS